MGGTDSLDFFTRRMGKKGSHLGSHAWTTAVVPYRYVGCVLTWLSLNIPLQAGLGSTHELEWEWAANNLMGLLTDTDDDVGGHITQRQDRSAISTTEGF